jgi:hypothetical protein
MSTVFLFTYCFSNLRWKFYVIEIMKSVPYQYQRKNKIVDSSVLTSRIQQPFVIIQPNFVEMLEMSCWRTEALVSSQGVSINYDSLWKLKEIIKRFYSVIYGQFLVGSWYLSPPATHSQHLYQIWLDYNKRPLSSGSGNRWVHHFLHDKGVSIGVN